MRGCKSLHAYAVMLEQQNSNLISSMKKIANPIPFMQEEAKLDGNRFDGQMAVSISNDPQYLKKLANDALAEHYGLGLEDMHGGCRYDIE